MKTCLITAIRLGVLLLAGAILIVSTPVALLYRSGTISVDWLVKVSDRLGQKVGA